MNEKEIIQYQNYEEERNNVRVEKSNRKRQHKRKNRIALIFSFLLIFSILYLKTKNKWIL